MGVEQEPYETFQTKLAALSGLSAIVGTRVGQEWPATNAGFPAVAWRMLTAGMADSDAEGWWAKHPVVQIDLIGDDFDVLQTLAAVVDGLNDAANDGSWNSANWKIQSVRRVSQWRRIDWSDRQTATGNKLLQYTADFSVKFNRIQS